MAFDHSSSLELDDWPGTYQSRQTSTKARLTFSLFRLGTSALVLRGHCCGRPKSSERDARMMLRWCSGLDARSDEEWDGGRWWGWLHSLPSPATPKQFPSRLFRRTTYCKAAQILPRSPNVPLRISQQLPPPTSPSFTECTACVYSNFVQAI